MISILFFSITCASLIQFSVFVPFISREIIIACWSVVMIVALKSSSDNSNVWLILVLVSVDFFIIHVVMFLVAVMVLSKFFVLMVLGMMSNFLSCPRHFGYFIMWLKIDWIFLAWSPLLRYIEMSMWQCIFSFLLSWLTVVEKVWSRNSAPLFGPANTYSADVGHWISWPQLPSNGNMRSSLPHWAELPSGRGKLKADPHHFVVTGLGWKLSSLLGANDTREGEGWIK